MKVSLVVAGGPKKGTAIPVTKKDFIVGRDSQCHLRPASHTVSKRHCALHVREGKVFVEDLKSTNGTVLNDAPLHGELELKDGDRLKIGPLDFFVKVETEAQVPTHVEKETRGPSAAAADAATENLDEDAIGNMLLNLTEDDLGEGEEAEDLEGTTIMQMLQPEELTKPKESAPYRPPAREESTEKSSSAAKAILEKYRRRPRS